MADEKGTRPDGRIALITALLILAIAAAGVIATLVARNVWWLPPRASEHGAVVDSILGVFIVLVGTVFIGVHLVLAWFVYRYARRSPGAARFWHENKTLELLWSAIPAAILVSTTVAGGIVWANINTTAPPDALTIGITAEQFGWRVQYPGPDGLLGSTAPELVTRQNPVGIDPVDPAGADDVVTLNDLRLPLNQPVRVLLRSKDVIHSFFVPELRVKRDAVPGRTVDFWFVPTATGSFELACAELCGAGHWAMRGQVQVLPAADWAAWLATR